MSERQDRTVTILRSEFMDRMRAVQAQEANAGQTFDVWVTGLTPAEREVIEADVAEQTRRNLDIALSPEHLRGQIMRDCCAAGLTPREARARTDAIITYLTLSVTNLLPRMTSMVTWHLDHESYRGMFTRQAIQMAWDYCEINPFARHGFMAVVEQLAVALERGASVANAKKPGIVRLKAAQDSE